MRKQLAAPAWKSLVLLSVLLGVLALACPAYADTVVAHDEDGTEYTSISDAVASGKALTMDADWEISKAFSVSSSLSIDMNGHKISRAVDSDGALFSLKDGSSLSLTASDTATKSFSYKAYVADGTTKDATVETGGLLTGANESAFWIRKGCTVSLTNVAIAGNSAVKNANKNGGAIYVAQSGSIITLDNVKIQGNYAPKSGGGIYNGGDWISDCIGSGAYITMKNGSVISENYAVDGAGVYIDRKNSVLEGGTIRDNVASSRGGGIYSNGYNMYVKSCTITDNKAGVAGGGIFAYNAFDAYPSGIVKVLNNKRGDNSDDDVFLDDTSHYLYTTQSFLMGGSNVEAGSNIGIRFNDPSSGDRDSDERCVVKGLSGYTEGTFFLNESDKYYFKYKQSSGWLFAKKGASSFPVTFRGATTYYAAGSTVTVDASKSGDSRVFKCWDVEKSTDGIITDSNKYDPVLTFKMPTKSVNLMPAYVDPAYNVRLEVSKPVAGEALPQEGTLVLMDGSSVETGRVTVPLEWREVAQGGKETPVTGVAKSTADYTVGATIAEDVKNGVLFSRDITAANAAVWVGTEGDHTSSQAASASVDAGTGTLSVRSGTISLGKTGIERVYPSYVEVKAGASRDDVAEKVKSEAAKAWVDLADGTTSKLDVDATGEIAWPEGLFDGAGKVVDPAGGEGSQTWDVELPVVCDEKTANPKGLKKTVRVVVYPSGAETVAAPALTPAGGSLALDGDLRATVRASCATDGATIMYKIDDGKERTYSNEIVLSGVADDSKKVSVEVWAERGDILESEHVRTEYTLDDTLGKELTVNQRDTAIEPVTGSFTVKGDLGAQATITAPVWEGHVFDHWEGKDVPADAVKSDLSLTIDKFSRNLDLTAVYAPVVTGLKLGLAAPVAGQKLTGSVSKIEAAAGESMSLEDVTGYFKTNDDGNLSVTWSPADTKADYLTAYAASIALEPKASADDVDYRLSEDIKVSVNGGDTDLTASVVEVGGGYALVITFPETDGGVLEKVVQPEEKSMGFAAAEAASSLVDQDDWALEDEDGNPVLPKGVAIELADGSCLMVDVEWTSFEGFNADAEGAQTVTVKGRVQLPSYIERNDVSLDVVQTLKVAAPETVEAPAASLKEGTYKGAQRVELACATEGATIRYTTDGSEPTETSPAYTGAIEVARSVKVRARAFREGMRASATASFSYAIEHEVAFDAAGGSKVASRWVADGERAERPADPTREGHEFAGWTLDGAAYDFSEPVTGDLELVATWKKADSDKKDDDSGKKDDGSDKKDDSKKDDGKTDDSGKKGDSGGKTDGGSSANGDGSNTQVRTETTTTTVTTAAKASARDRGGLARTGDIVLGYVLPLAAAGFAAVMAASIVRKRRTQ